MTVRLQTDPFEPGDLLTAFRQGQADVGAVVSFTGLVRADGGTVQALELEAYAGFTDLEIERIAEDAAARHGLIDVLIVHRIGRMVPGDPIVFVATAAAHRRAAFEAADQLMDYLKSRAPFWKKSHETGGARWIEPRGQDYSDAARWDPAPDKGGPDNRGPEDQILETRR
jgi:molybdopterin synthase catalytic subunit